MFKSVNGLALPPLSYFCRREKGLALVIFESLFISYVNPCFITEKYIWLELGGNWYQKYRRITSSKSAA